MNLLVAVLVAQAAGAGLRPSTLLRPHIQAARAAAPPVIDGKLDDKVWQAAQPSDTFTQHFPDEGAPPSERTTVRVLYDQENIYVGIDCEQVRSPIGRRLTRRDSPLPSDGVWIDIDSRRDGRTAFHFGVNTAGVLSDALHFNDTDYSADWDAVWEAKVADTPRGYSVEFRVPLRVLRFSALPVQDWGFQVRRFIDARQETDDWAFYPRTAGGYVPHFGRIEGLVGLAPRRSLEVRPFVLGRLRHRAPDAAAGTLASGFDVDGSIGADARAIITNELVLDLTANPDFGQVEADTVLLNLSTFEIFFPEKRPFFLQGMEMFAGIRPLVYTRRVGQQPPAPVLGTGELLVDNPDPARIFGAVKLTGRLDPRTTVGLLSAMTGETDVQVQLADGTRVARPADALTVFNVARAKRFLLPDLDVGVMATAVNRVDPSLLPGGLCPLTQAPAAADGRCTNDAYVGAVDGRWRSPTGNYAAAGQALVTALAGGPARPQPDGIAVEPGAVSGGGSLYVGKQGGRRWLWNAWQHLAGQQLEFNDLGYLERKNDYQGYFDLVYRTAEPWWKTIETRSTLQLQLRETLDGINLWNSVELNTWWNLPSFWNFSVEVHYRGARFDDREMGDGAALERAGRVGIEAGVTSDPRRRVTGWVFAQLQYLDGGMHAEARGQATFRLLPQLEVDLLPTMTYDRGEPRFVATEAGSYLFGVQQARSVGATLRAAYTFTPELSLQVYTQVFLARVRYEDFSSFAPIGFRQRVHLDDLAPGAPPPAITPDSQEATLNVNVVLRWEYRLGSTLFLVYTRAQNPVLMPTPGTGASLDIRPVLNGQAAVDVLMAKLTYWWG